MVRTLKILLITVIAVLCQTNFAPFLRVRGIAPDLMIATLTALSFHCGSYGGFCSGAIMAMLYDSAVGYILALDIILYTLIGYAAFLFRQPLEGKMARNRNRRWLEAVLLGFALTAIREIADIGYLFLIGAEQGLVTIIRMLACSGYTAVFAVPTLWLLDRFLSSNNAKKNLSDRV